MASMQLVLKLKQKHSVQLNSIYNQITNGTEPTCCPLLQWVALAATTKKEFRATEIEKQSRTQAPDGCSWMICSLNCMAHLYVRSQLLQQLGYWATWVCNFKGRGHAGIS